MGVNQSLGTTTPIPPAGGDLGSNEAVVSVSGAGGNVNISASQTTLDSGSSVPVVGSVSSLQTTDASAHAVFTYAHPDNTVADFIVTVVGRNHGNNGDFYRCDLGFTAQRFAAGAPTIAPSSPAPSNARNNGAGTAYVVAVAVSSNNILINVTGAASTTVDWSAAVQIQIRS